MSDPVNHPQHYAHPSGVEAIDICEHLTFNLGNALKYLWRAGKKGPAAEDYRKAAWYPRREADRLGDHDIVQIPRVVRVKSDAVLRAGVDCPAWREILGGLGTLSIDNRDCLMVASMCNQMAKWVTP